ncbi:MAG: hypothetical protein BGP03_31615 [Pseudonocardia sp. 73-21]|nr:MAG: hypothetical protein BGP03_31615 [Pseudonocardia sp. 73-21]
MPARDPDEQHRTSTPLELLFDLCFVVAVSQAAAQLARGLEEGHLGTLGGYAMVFFAIWWSWMNVTWFASAYDTDDVPYRLLTLVQMAGVLILAAGVPAALNGDDYSVVTIGYAVMRVPGIAQWLLPPTTIRRGDGPPCATQRTSPWCRRCGSPGSFCPDRGSWPPTSCSCSCLRCRQRSPTRTWRTSTPASPWPRR